MSLRMKTPKQTEKKINKTVNGAQSHARNNGFFILRGPFVFDAAHEPELLQVEADEEAIIMRNGIHFINSGLLSPDGKSGTVADNDFRELVDSVMNNPTSSKSGD